MQDNIEALAWQFYSKHRHEKDGGFKSVKDFADWQHGVYGKKIGAWESTYGGSKGRAENYTMRLFKEIASAHGDTWGEGKITANKGSRQASFLSLKDYHESNRNRPEWMDNLGDPGVGGKLRDFTEVQSSFVGQLSPLIGRKKQPMGIQQRAEELAQINQGINIWKVGQTQTALPAGAITSLEGELDAWRNAKKKGSVWEETPRHRGSLRGQGGPVIGDVTSSPRLIFGEVDEVDGLSTNRARRHKRRSVSIAPGSLGRSNAGGFLPNFGQKFSGQMRGLSDESFLPNFGLLEDELASIDGSLYPGKSVNWWRNLRSEGWYIDEVGKIVPPEVPEVDPGAGGWSHPLMGMGKRKREMVHATNVDSAIRTLGSEYLTPIAGEAPEELEARLAQFRNDTISETNPIKNFPRAKGLMYRAMGNIIGGMPSEMRTAVWARYKAREKLPWHILGIDDATLQKTGANYDTRTNTMVLSKADVQELRTSSVSPQLREKFMKQFIVQMQDEVLREVGTTGSDYLRGEETGSMKVKGAKFGEDPWSTGSLDYESKTTGFSQDEAEWGRRAADNLLWKMWDSASATAGDDEEFISRIDQVANEEKNWASVRRSFGAGSLMDSRSTSTNAFGYTVSRWINNGRKQGYWQHDYKSEIEDKLAEVSRGHGGHSDWRKHGRDIRKNLMFEVNDRVAEAKFGRLGEYIGKRKREVGRNFPVTDEDMRKVAEYDSLKQRGWEQAGAFGKLGQRLGMGPTFKTGIYSSAKVYGSLDEYRNAMKPLDQRVEEYAGADPSKWTGEKHSKHFEKMIRDERYDEELNKEYRQLRVSTKASQKRVESGGAPYSQSEFDEVIRFRELEQGRLAQKGKGEVVTRLAQQIKAEKEWVKENKKRGFSGAFPQNDRQRDLLQQYEEARRGNVRVNFRSGMGSVAALGARVTRWDPWEGGGDFDERQKREAKERRMEKKFVNPDGSKNLNEPYQRRDNKGKELKVQEGQQVPGGPEVGQLITPLYGRTAFGAWRADEWAIRSRKEYEDSDVYKSIEKARKARERQYRITSVADANSALRKVGYGEKELRELGLGYTVMDKKERRGLLTKRGKLEQEIETMKTLAPQNPNPPITQEQIALKDMELAELNLVLDKSKNLNTPEQLQRTEDELNKDFADLYRLREEVGGGGRLGRYHETEYDVVSGKIEGIKDRRRDSQRVLSDKQIMKAAARADGMYDILLREGVKEEDANAIVNGVPLGKLMRGAEREKVQDILMEYGPPRIRPKDYASAMRGPDSKFGKLEKSTEASLRNKRKNLFLDATRLEGWLRDPQRDFSEKEFLEAYSQMDIKTRARTKQALRSLTSETIGGGIMYGTGGEGAVQLSPIDRDVRDDEHKRLLELTELKDDSEKIKFIKNLIQNDGLGEYMSSNPKSNEEVSDVVDRYWHKFATEVDTNDDGQPDKFESLPGLQNKLVTDIISSRTMDPAGLDWEDRGGKLIDEQAREDRKAKYVKDLARTRKLATLLTGSNGGQWRRWINEHPNKASFGDSPALNLLNSGQADQVVAGEKGTALNVLSALQKGSFMAQFMHLDVDGRSRMLDTLRELKVYNGGASLLDDHTRDRVKTQVLKDQGITLDYTGEVALDRKNFDSTDDFFAAKGRRRDEFMAAKDAKRQAALDARAERIKFGDPQRRAQELAERQFRLDRDATINDRVGRGQEPLPELENLATGFIPNLAPPQKDPYSKDSAADLKMLERDQREVDWFRENTNVSFHTMNRKGSRAYERDGATSDVRVQSVMEKQYDAWQESGQRIPGPTNKFQPEYPGQVPRRSLEQIVEPFITPTTEEVEKAEILGSRKEGYYNYKGEEIGDWDYRGYTKMGDTPGRPASKVLPSLIKGAPAKKGEEYFSINKQWHTMSQFREGRKLKLGGQTVTVMGTKGSEGVMQVQTESGQIVDIPLRGEAAQERAAEQRSTRQKGAQIEFARGFVPNFSPKGQSAIVNEIAANRKVGQFGVRPKDVGRVKLNAGRGQSPVEGTMVRKGQHAENLVKTDLGDFVVPAQGQRGAYVNRLKKQADAAGLHGLPEAVMSKTNAQGFIPNLQEASVGINNVEEMKGLVERFEGTAQQIATTITEGSMEISHALNIEGKVAGLDQGQLINALQGAMSETASIEAGRQVKGAFNDNTLNSEVAPAPTDVPRFDRPGNT